MSFSVTANSPSLGHIAWAGVHIVYDGVDYTVANGNTNRRFVFWRKAQSGVLQTSDTHPALTQDDAIVFLNKSGVPVNVLNATAMDGDLVVPGTVTATALAVDSVAATHIQSDAVVARHIVAGAITAEKLAVLQLSAISADMGDVTAGNITLDANGFIRGGAVSFDSGVGIWMGKQGSFYKFRAGAPGSSRMEWNGQGFFIYGPNGEVTISSGVVDYTKVANQPTSLSNINPTEGEKLATVQPGATRNVFRGAWDTNTDYVIGDVVLDEAGYGWSCTSSHTSSSTVKPPVYPATSNSRWTLYTVKGKSGDSYSLALSDTSIVRDPAGVYSKNSVTVKAYKLEEGKSNQLYAGRILVKTSTNWVTFTDAYSSSINESSATFVLPVGIKEARFFLYAAGVIDFQNTAPLQSVSLPILDDATVYSVELQSSNGTVFRRGEARQTTLTARVFRNGQEITDTVPTSAFKWIRTSLDPQPPPNDDAEWNRQHAAGFKSVVVSVDDVFARATFKCDVSF